MNNVQLILAVSPIVLATALGQVTTIVVLIFGFLSNNKRLDDIVARLGRIEERLTAVEKKVEALEIKAWR